MKNLRFEFNAREKFKVDKQYYRFTSVTRIIPETRANEEKRIIEETVQIINPDGGANYYRADRTFDEGGKAVWEIIRNSTKEVVKTIASEGNMEDYEFMTAEVLHELNKTVK